MGTKYPVLYHTICVIIFSHMCVKYGHTTVSLDTLIPIPHSSIQGVQSNSTYSTCHISCYSQHNQIYSNNVDIFPPPADVLQDSDFAISILFSAELQERRYLLIYYDQPNSYLLFGLWVAPGDSQVGITYRDCSGELNTIPLSSDELEISTELFLAVSIAQINSTDLLISSVVGDSANVTAVEVSGSLECSFPPNNKYATGFSYTPDGTFEQFYGSFRDPAISGRSLTDREIELIRRDEQLNGENSSYPECICPKGYNVSTDVCCYNPHTNATSFRITPDSYTPELAIDGNPCTYWRSSSSDQFVSLSLSFSPALSMVQLVRIQFLSPPNKLTLSVTSANETFVVAHIDPSCESVSNSTYRCIRSLEDVEESNCCVTPESLIDNSVLEILFSIATPLRDVSSLTLYFSQLPISAEFYSVSDIQLYSPADFGIEENETSIPSVLTSSTLSVGDRSSLFVFSSVPSQQRSYLSSSVPSLTPTPRLSSSVQSRYITPVISIPYSLTTPVISVPYSLTTPVISVPYSLTTDVISHTISTQSTLKTDTVYSSSLLQQTYSVTKQTTFSTQITSPQSYATSSIPTYSSTPVLSQIPSMLQTTTTTTMPSQSLAAITLSTYTPIFKLTPTSIPSSSLLSTSVPSSAQVTSSAFHSTSTVAPSPTPVPTPLPPCYQPILPSRIQISLLDNAGYKQLHFSENSSHLSQISILPTRDSYQVAVDIPFGLRKGVHFQSSLPFVYTLDYYIHSTTVWDQDPYFRISLVPLNTHNSLSYRDTELAISLTLDSLSISQNTTLSRNNTSNLVTFLIPTSWFLSSALSVSFIAESQLSVLISTTLSLQLLSALAHNLSITASDRPALLLTLPTYPLAIDSTATLSVYLLADTGARYLSARFGYPPNSSVENIDPSFQWDFSSNSSVVVVSGFVKIPIRQNGMFKLFDINLILHNSNGTVSCDLIQLYDDSFNPLTPPIPPCYLSGPSGISEYSGQLNILSDSVTSIAAYPLYAVLYNHAVLSHSEVRIPISVYLYTETGVSLDYTQLACNSSDTDVIKVALSCSYLYTDGSELTGAHSVLIHFSHKQLQTGFSIKVLFPDIPIALSLEDPILNTIPVFPTDTGCQSKFQRSRLIAYANFSTEREIVLNIDVLDFVRDSLYVSDTDLAMLGEDSYLEGVSVGTGSITVEINNRQLGATQFVVSSDPVTVICYSPHVYSDVSVTNTQSELYEPFIIELLFHRTFLYNSTLGYSIVFLQFSDDTVMPTASYHISVSSGVLHSANTFSLMDNSTLAFSLPTCPALPSLSFITNVDLSTPDSVRITLSSQILTTEGDPASIFGYNTSALLRVLLVYVSESVDASNAPFTGIDIRNPNLINRVKTDIGTKLETRHSSGQTQIVVSLPWLSMTKSISVQVVNIEGLQISLLPSYSATSNISVLSMLGPDSYQIAYLQADIILSYSIYRAVTDITLLTLQVREYDEQTNTPGVITDKAYFTDNILHINSTAVTADTELIVLASYGVFTASYVVSISTDSLAISHFSAFELIPNLTGLLGSQFAINFGFTLSDGTGVTRYFQEGVPPVALRFEVSDPSSVFLDSSTGLLSLLGNSEGLVFIRVSIGNVSTVSNGFAVNLAPNGNGIDIGNEVGIALPHQQVNTTFKIPIWLQTYSDFKSIDVTLLYDRAVLSLVSISPGSPFSGGVFLSQPYPPGVVRLGGIVPQEQVGTRLLIAEIQLEAVRAERAELSASANSLSGPFPLYANLLSLTDSAVTNLTQVITPGSNNVYSPWSNERKRSSRSVSCSERGTTVSGRAVCTLCSSQVRGDLNRDCLFNLNDVSYLLDYITASYTGFSSDSSRLLREEFEQLTLSTTDVNQDTKLTIADVYYLNWVNFGLFYFLQSVEISLAFPSNALPSVYSCELVVSVQLDSPPSGYRYNRFYVYIELTAEISLQLVTQGEYVTNATRGSISSGIYKTDSLIFKAIIPSNQSEYGVSPILLASDGQQTFYQPFTDRFPPSLNYPELRATLPFSPSPVSLIIPAGYSPYRRYTPPPFCGAEPVPLRILGGTQARELTLFWPQTGGRGPYTLRRVLCARIGRESIGQYTCNGIVGLNSNIEFPEYRVTSLNPFSVYRFKMEVEGRSSQWTQFNTSEADPESLLVPLLTRYNLTCVHVRWEEPDITNGFITGYSLLLNSSVDQEFEYNTTSHLLCGDVINYDTSVVIQANNSVGSVQSKSVLTSSIGAATVRTSRYDARCVELAWPHLIFNVTLSTEETFDVTIDNQTLVLRHDATRILVCGLVTDGVPFLLEITSSRVGKIFSDSVTIPTSRSFPYYILLYVLLPLLAAILLLVACVAVAICWWKSSRYAMFKMQRDVRKSKDYWSTEEDFVEVSPVDIQPMEKRLFVTPQQMEDEFGRDRSGSFESSDSWVERGPILDVEKGITEEHAPQHSFDSSSYSPTEAQDDTSAYTNPNNNTIVSEDRSLSALTPRKAHSMRGRPRAPPPGSDLRKAKMSHSWHNLRHKRFLKLSVSALERKRSSERRKKHSGSEQPEDNIPISDISSEVYHNPADSIQPVMETITPLLSSDSSTDEISTHAPIQSAEQDICVAEQSEELYHNQNEVTSLEQNTIEATTLEQIETPLELEPIDTNPLEASTIPVTLSDPSQPVSKPHTARSPAPAPIQDAAPPSLSGKYSRASTDYQPEDSHSSQEGSQEEAAISKFVRPVTSPLVARPSLDLSEGHVIGIALGLETGDLPLEENRPSSFLHKLSFTALPEEESLDSRRSIFQSPGELYTIESEIQTIPPDNPVTAPTDSGEETD